MQVLAVEDEEFCAIPMGGCLPARPQRVIGVGGTAGMVHPSTGYMVRRPAQQLARCQAQASGCLQGHVDCLPLHRRRDRHACCPAFDRAG